jgi:hypothetical protein
MLRNSTRTVPRAVTQTAIVGEELDEDGAEGGDADSDDSMPGSNGL